MSMELELEFTGAFAVITKTKHATISFEDHQVGYEDISREVERLVSTSIPFIILRQGANLQRQLDAGAKLDRGEVLTVVPLILGG